MEYNIYCDESCHLENDKNRYMVIGCVYCPKNKVKEISLRLKKLKKEYGLENENEIKWTKIMSTKMDLYRKIIDLFFYESSIKFRAVVVDKFKLNHSQYNQTHDEFYHKIYFDMLKYIISNENSYNIYVDIKDTNSKRNFQKVHKYLGNKIYDVDNRTMKKIQMTRSHEVVMIQFADLFIGAMSYYYRKIGTSNNKNQLIHDIQRRLNHSLDKNTPFYENKFNILLWEGGKIE
ncbi:MAG: hypothetical protein A2Y24_07535 [Clostridiales bacterium GWE2_32_10]|nr:MAG: hypothetical protein A2Y24_07535 [Clostridiales bacterium GWE2_32_10]HBY21610.1 DUF3800 domain-containing protein [Clostridiales bacterium]